MYWNILFTSFLKGLDIFLCKWVLALLFLLPDLLQLLHREEPVSLPRARPSAFVVLCACVCASLCVRPLRSFMSQLLWVSSSHPLLSHSTSGCLVTPEWKFPIASLSPRTYRSPYLFKAGSERSNNACFLFFLFLEHACCLCVRVCTVSLSGQKLTNHS